MIKKYDIFVKEELDTFYEDLSNSQKRIKLFISFDVSDLKKDHKDIKINVPKKKFQPKVQVYQKESDKGVF